MSPPDRSFEQTKTDYSKLIGIDSKNILSNSQKEMNFGTQDSKPAKKPK